MVFTISMSVLADNHRDILSDGVINAFMKAPETDDRHVQKSKAIVIPKEDDESNIIFVVTTFVHGSSFIYSKLEVANSSMVIQFNLCKT